MQFTKKSFQIMMSIFLTIFFMDVSLAWSEGRGPGRAGNWWEQNRGWNNDWQSNDEQNFETETPEYGVNQDDLNVLKEKAEEEKELAEKLEAEKEAAEKLAEQKEQEAEEKNSEEKSAAKKLLQSKLYMGGQAIKKNNDKTRFIMAFTEDPAAYHGAAVLDKETGLIWQGQPWFGTATYSEAFYGCLNKKIGGRHGWRVPRPEELLSLLTEPEETDEAPSNYEDFKYLYLGVGNHFQIAWPVKSKPTFWAFPGLDGKPVVVDMGNHKAIPATSAKRYYWCVRKF